MNMSQKGFTKGQPTTIKKPQKPWPTIKRLGRYMKKGKLSIIITLFAAIIGTTMQVLSPKFLGNATTTVFTGAVSGNIDFEKLSATLLLVGGLYAGVCLTTFLQERLMVVLSQKITYAMRNELKIKMSKLPISYFDKNSTGDLMSIAVNDMDNIVTMLQQNLTQLISSIILVIGMLWIMISISPVLTLLACIMIPGSTLVMKVLTPGIRKNSRKYFQFQGTLNGQIEEAFHGFTVVKAFHGEAELLEKFNEINQEMYQSGWKAKFFGGTMMPCMIVVQNAVYMLIAVIGALKVIAGSILIGDMQAFLQYTTQFSQPFSQFSQIWNGILSTIASAERVFQVLDEQEMAFDKGAYLNSKEGTAKVTFDGVRFSYSEKPLMTNFSMDVTEGQMVAIVGHTGAGKTTLLNLLQRFYEIQDGSIRIDGTDIRNLDPKETRQRIGMVLQDTWLFSGTIYENIRYGNPLATETQIYAAAKAAYADDFIRKLPDGYHTILKEDGVNISGGQRQLITIARAFIANPEILILDEATSNVDSRTELIIQKAMKKLLKGRTSFVVAHRLSTIYDADCIIVMEKGNIVEQGTHCELLNHDGTYADIYHSQFAAHSA